jgi:thioredoxin reductase (NADPH)
MKEYDAILVGAGPCGLAAAADFRRAGVEYVHLEQGRLAQSIQRFPKGITLFSPRRLLGFGGMPLPGNQDEPPQVEEYLRYLREVTESLQLCVKTHQRIHCVKRTDAGYLLSVSSTNGWSEDYLSRNLVVATGGSCSPVLLGIPGEELAHVSHYFRSDTPARGQSILVVGAGNSAIEACNILASQGASVTLSYRRQRLSRRNIKPWLLPHFHSWVKMGRVRRVYNSIPSRIDSGKAYLLRDSNEIEAIECDRAYLLTGYGPDYSLLKMAEVPFHKRTHRPLFSPQILQTRRPGVFLCGTIVLKWNGEQANIGNTRDHGRIILQHLHR